MRTFRCLGLAVVGLLACSSSDSYVGGGGDDTVACRQKAGADGDSDCDGHGSKTRKLDCDSQEQTDEALAAGCELEKEGDSDVCCPTSVSGTKESATLACTEPADTLTASDCAGTSLGRKLDCVSSSEQNDAFAAGCAAEDAGDPTDFDVCCPVDVRGVH